MNALNEAAELLKTNWCTGDLTRGDRYCALGALGAVKRLIASDRPLMPTESDWATDPDAARQKIREVMTWESEVYGTLEEMPEVKVLAETIREQHPEIDKTVLIDSDDWATAVVYTFNDKQDEPEPVIAMFEKAAVKFDERVNP